jgi:hypothetical protein
MPTLILTHGASESLLDNKTRSFWFFYLFDGISRNMGGDIPANRRLGRGPGPKGPTTNRRLGRGPGPMGP